MKARTSPPAAVSSVLLAAALAAALVALLPAPGAAQFPLPSGHPRIFFTPASFAAIADRCKVGGTHRTYYTRMKAFADARIGMGQYNVDYAPNYALVYRIHKAWNQSGYQGGGFQEDTYAQAAKNAVLNGGAWEQNEIGAMAAITADWVWDRLTPAEIAQIAGYYGAPNPIVVDDDTWRAGHSFGVVTQTMRSILFTGAGVNDAGYAAEYAAILGYLQGIYAPAMELQGGVGTSGPHYDNESQFLRSWCFEAMRSASGVDPWPLCQKWASEFGKWNVFARNPMLGSVELQQDALPFNSPTDSPWNSVLLALRGRDPYAQYVSDEFTQDSQSWEQSDYRLRVLWAYVLWYDPTLAAANLASAPLAARLGAGGADHIYMRSSWTDPNPLTACFEAGKYYYGHQHVDAGSFLLSRKGYLVLDSGGYYTYASSNGEDYSSSYYQRSIAHNVVHVYDQTETFWENWNSNIQIVNDGGQHVPPSDPIYNDVLTLPEFSTGEILRYEGAGTYTYAQANLAPAYNSARLMQRYGKPPYTNKITAYTREFIYLRPDVFVVIDRVRAKSASLSKVWNLHVAGDPVVSGTGVQRMGDATAGIWDYAGAEVAKVTDPSTSFSRGSLFVKSLMPKQRIMRKIGGRNRDASGFAYWVGGFDGSGRYDPTRGANHYWGSWNPGREDLEESIWAAPIGWGRIEVEPAVQAVEDIFLHVLYPCDESVGSMPDTRLVESPNVVGAEVVNRRIVLFGRTETANLDSMSYSVQPNDTAAVHTITDLTPGATYRVYKAGTTYTIRKSTFPAPPGATEIVTPPPVATPAGVIEFASVGGSFLIRVTNVTVEPQAPSLAVTIRWQTDRASDSQVEFGTTTSYGQLSDLDPALVTSHAVTIASPAIANDQTYQFRAVSRAPGGYSGTSSNGQFRVDVVPPSRVSDLLVR